MGGDSTIVNSVDTYSFDFPVTDIVRKTPKPPVSVRGSATVPRSYFKQGRPWVFTIGVEDVDESTYEGGHYPTSVVQTHLSQTWTTVAREVKDGCFLSPF